MSPLSAAAAQTPDPLGLTFATITKREGRAASTDAAASQTPDPLGPDDTDTVCTPSLRLSSAACRRTALPFNTGKLGACADGGGAQAAAGEARAFGQRAGTDPDPEDSPAIRVIRWGPGWTPICPAPAPAASQAGPRPRPHIWAPSRTPSPPCRPIPPPRAHGGGSCRAGAG